ncbi:MAG TPA: SDR family oxidoreductase [Thermoanaerobaculia bacterium]|nr:SDR family oxidoreductase [Thermoanaerobaculia bacterium]
MESIAGQTVLVTGATSGIGLETARALAKKGARVVVGARDARRGQAVVDEIAAGGGRAELLEIDMASLALIRKAADRFSAAHSKLDVLVNNAGTAVSGRRLSADGHELTWATNFLGPFLLTRRLLSFLKKSETPRVVNVGSEGHRAGRIDWDNLELERGYSTFRAYANSKLALALFTRELARREPGVAAVVMHPGGIATKIWGAAPRPISWILNLVLPSAAKGAAPVVRLASAPDLARVTGRYFNRFREAVPSAAARNDADAARLWDLAQTQTS